MKSIQTILLLILFGQLNAQIEQSVINSIHTQSEVDTLITPDEIYLSILTNEREAKEDLDKLESQMFKALTNIGINTSEQLRIDNFGSYYHSKFFRKDIKQKRQYELKVNSKDQAISTLLILNELEIGKIDLIKTDYSQKDDLMLNLRTKAVSKAKKQALALASPLNQKVGRAIKIIDLDDDTKDNLMSTMTGGYLEQSYYKIKEETKSIQMELKPIKFIKKVLVQFELK